MGLVCGRRQTCPCCVRWNLSRVFSHVVVFLRVSHEHFGTSFPIDRQTIHTNIITIIIFNYDNIGRVRSVACFTDDTRLGRRDGARNIISRPNNIILFRLRRRDVYIVIMIMKKKNKKCKKMSLFVCNDNVARNTGNYTLYRYIMYRVFIFVWPKRTVLREREREKKYI